MIIDDERDMLALLRRIITENTTHEVITESDPIQALKQIKEEAPDLVLTDLKMPKMGGLQLLLEIKQAKPAIPVIILTAYATIETAVEAIQKGAYDYLTKPFTPERILLTIDKVIKWQEMVKENLELRQALSEKNGHVSMVGSTQKMKEIFDRILQIAPTTATVLITGPSGTGKELVAKAIHRNSLRKAKKIITVNCTAIPEQVIESELFGHVKGAFTGAWRDKKGLVEEAHEGTLFLDEIGDLSPLLQTKLLRLLQEGEFKAVGSVVTRKADLRFIAATNHNLKTEIKEKRFREDLFYRLNVIHIELPPLKERKEDIPLLSYHFLKKYTRIYQKDIADIAPAAMTLITSQEYQGNVRELENIIERGVLFCRDKTLKLRDLFLDQEQSFLNRDMEQETAGLSFKEAKDRMIRLFHAQYVQALLKESEGNISRAAELAGIQRQYLHRLIKESGIEADYFRQKSE